MGSHLDGQMLEFVLVQEDLHLMCTVDKVSTNIFSFLILSYFFGVMIPHEKFVMIHCFWENQNWMKSMIKMAWYLGKVK